MSLFALYLTFVYYQHDFEFCIYDFMLLNICYLHHHPSLNGDIPFDHILHLDFDFKLITIFMERKPPSITKLSSSLDFLYVYRREKNWSGENCERNQKSVLFFRLCLSIILLSWLLSDCQFNNFSQENTLVHL